MSTRQAWTRRAVLSSIAAVASGAPPPRKLERIPSERKRFADSSTELPLFRLTDPAHSSLFPAPYCRMLSRRSGYLLYASDRTGSFQAFRMDLKTGESEQLTHAADLDPSSLTLLPDESAFCYFDGPSLRLARFKDLREREIYRVPDGVRRGPGFSVSPDAAFVMLIENADGGSKLHVERLGRGGGVLPLASKEPLAHPQASPRGDFIMCRRGENELWLVRRDGRDAHRAATAPGRISQAWWSPDGASVLYLSIPDKPGERNSIHELDCASNSDRLVALTSQFVTFAPNADASVFAGASGSKAAPYVLLLLRRTRREMALCEHRSSDASSVTVVFAPDSQQLYFVSDRTGKPSIYAMPLARLVEPTSAV